MSCAGGFRVLGFVVYFCINGSLCCGFAKLVLCLLTSFVKTVICCF